MTEAWVWQMGEIIMHYLAIVTVCYNVNVTDYKGIPLISCINIYENEMHKELRMLLDWNGFFL